MDTRFRQLRPDPAGDCPEELQARRLEACLGCEFRDSIRCRRAPKYGQGAGVIMHWKGLPRLATRCPEGLWPED